MFPATNAAALPIYVLMLLAGSRCYPKPRPGLGPRPTHICCPYPVTRPQYSTEKLSPLGTWNGWVGNDKKPAKSRCGDRFPTGWGEKEKGKREKGWMSLILLRTAPCAGQSPIHRDPLPLLPTSHNAPWATLCHATPGGGGNWAATMATSQVGTKSFV